LGCAGGDQYDAFIYLTNTTSITDRTCSIYQSIGWTDGQKCSPMEQCRNCAPSKACVIPEAYMTYNLTEYGRVVNETPMM